MLHHGFKLQLYLWFQLCYKPLYRGNMQANVVEVSVMFHAMPLQRPLKLLHCNYSFGCWPQVKPCVAQQNLVYTSSCFHVYKMIFTFWENLNSSQLQTARHEQSTASPVHHCCKTSIRIRWNTISNFAHESDKKVLTSVSIAFHGTCIEG